MTVLALSTRCSNLAAAFSRVLGTCRPPPPLSRGLPLKPPSQLRRMSTSRAQGLGYRKDVKVVPLLSDTLPDAVLDGAPPDHMWLTEVLEEQEKASECSNETKIDKLQVQLSHVLDKSLEIQESLMKMHQRMGEAESLDRGMATGPKKVAPSFGGGGSRSIGESEAREREGDRPPVPSQTRSFDPRLLPSAAASSASTPASTPRDATPLAGTSPATTPRSAPSTPATSPEPGPSLGAAARGRAAPDGPAVPDGCRTLAPVAETSGPSTAPSTSCSSTAKGSALARPTQSEVEELRELRARLEAAERALTSRPLHVHARSQQNPRYPQRAAVPDTRVEWRVPWPDYAPLPYTALTVVESERTETNPTGWADAADVSAIRAELNKRLSFEGVLLFDGCGRPVNPRGRTGICDRGALGRWGPNHAADPIVTRWKPGGVSGAGCRRQLQFVAIKRGDTGAWALPGGMVDAGEKVSETVRREFEEEAGNVADGEDREAFSSAVSELFAKGRVVYQGYVDDPRNTDHAWMETTAFHFHCSESLGTRMPLRAGDDARDVRWLDVDPTDALYAGLYASHREWVDHIARELTAAAPAAPAPEGRAKFALLGFGGKVLQKISLAPGKTPRGGTPRLGLPPPSPSSRPPSPLR